ncbi:type II secretion system protein [Microcoleus sp. FACHB-1515]|uniref:pilus assembly FimT family protein n=1 Tax=Leptolyngbya sp. FACHB-1515 TaxID=2933931 RepID=UPI0016862760|nr:type II secretion system protein [Microcoleus sp. FACHB-1515]MBD2091366.1 type II secretion system protein [Microcoleus sp. FACHB-1515]
MRTKLLKSSAAGFTLIELIVVMVMIGVLFSIAAPGWLAFANRQRVNSVRDELLQEIRRAQATAAQTRRDQQFTVIPENPPNVPWRVQVAPPGTSLGSQARDLGNGQVQGGVIRIEATNNIRSLVFDERGNLVTSEELPPDGLKFTVSLASNPNVRSCAIVQTLLGATRSGRGNECN